MAQKKILNKSEAYLLGGALFLGAVTYANAQEQRRYIYGDKELTAAGDGIFAKSYINEVDMFSGDYSLGNRFSSKDKIKYSCIDAKKGVEKIAENMKSDSLLTGKEKAFKHYLKGLAKTLKINDKRSLKMLDNAVKDGVISPVRDSLYDENGWKLNDEVYLIVAKTAKESVPTLVHFKAKTYDDIVLEETRENQSKLEQEAQEDSCIPEQPYLKKEYSVLKKKIVAEKVPKSGTYLAPEDESARFGLEAGMGTNNEIVTGAFIDLPLISWLRIGGFGNWYAETGKMPGSETSTQITQRQSELIGSTIYRDRTDEMTTILEGKPIAEYGAEIAFKTEDVEFPLRAGTHLSDEKKTLEGKSTIIHTSEGQLLEAPTVISNTKDCGHSTKSDLYLSAGVRFNLTENLSLGGSYNRIGKKNSGRVSLRYTF